MYKLLYCYLIDQGTFVKQQVHSLNMSFNTGISKWSLTNLWNYDQGYKYTQIQDRDCSYLAQ